jgi:tetratricopeptide (TPR) repeat protein
MALAPWAVVSNLFVPVGTIFGERFLYLPSVGFCILLAMGCGAVAERVPRRLLGVAVATLLIVWAARTVIRNRVWASDVTLAPATAVDAPRSGHAHQYLASVYVDLGRDDDALAQLAEATQLLAAYPDWPERLDVLYDTALIHGRRGQTEKATSLYEEIVARAPDYFPAWINLGALRNQQGDHAGALVAADRAVTARPDVPNAYLVRGHALRGLRRPQEAMAAFESALERAPWAVEALMGLGAAAYEAGDYEQAVRTFRQLVAAAPSPDAYRGLIACLDAMGQRDEARRVVAQATARYPENSNFRDGGSTP